MAITKEAVLEALRTVQDPELFKDIVTLNMVKDINISDGRVAVGVELTTPACPMKDKIRGDVNAALARVPGVTAVQVNFTAQVRGSGPSAGASGPASAGKPNALPLVKNTIAVGAGKGGVGKSTIALNLAVGLAIQGAKVGLMDADVYGPSIPTMAGLEGQSPTVSGDRMVPLLVGPAGHGIKVMSIGFLVPKEKALIWRGPMVHGVVKQFLEQVEWGELDYLIIDLPPGTGDVSLTLSQQIPLTGAVIVATPQEVALMDARRAVRMFQQLGVEILGVVENMSYFVCEHGQEYDIFGRGGAQHMAQTMGLPFLGEVPIDMTIRQNGDTGNLIGNYQPGASANAAMTGVTELLAGQISIRNMTRPAAKKLSLQISD